MQTGQSSLGCYSAPLPLSDAPISLQSRNTPPPILFQLGLILFNEVRQIVVELHPLNATEHFTFNELFFRDFSVRAWMKARRPSSFFTFVFQSLLILWCHFKAGANFEESGDQVSVELLHLRRTLHCLDRKWRSRSWIAQMTRYCCAHLLR